MFQDEMGEHTVMNSKSIFFLLLGAAACAAQPSAPHSLRVEYLTNPAGIDVRQPRFYWTPAHGERGAGQSACKILVSTRPDAAAGDAWDSGKVASPDFVHVVYQGKPLESGRTYYWRVRFWDQQDRPSAYSRAATFGVGLLTRAEWKGKWIGGGNQLRREFQLKARPVRAKVHIAGVGYYELRLNGRKVGNHVLDPAYTTYAKRILYETYDITDRLQPGANAVGVMLGEGWFGNRSLLVQLNVELPGGEEVTVSTDGAWKTTQGPVLSDSIYHGETYDARKETPGWDRPGYDESAWKAAAVLTDPPQGELSAQMMPPIRVVGEINPLTITNPRPGVYVYDLGQNFSGWMRLRVKGPRGARVQLRHAELLYDNGMLNVENLRSARATDVYILRGDGEPEVWEPRFTYHGFRYVELTGYPGTPDLATLTGRIVNSDVRPHGGFSASKPLLNQMQRIIVWGTRSNLHSVPTDCNQRDERMGWMADAHLYAETAMLNFDMAAFYTNFLRGMSDAQAADGSVPDTVPRARFAQGPADPAWGSAYPLILWYAWQHYGDRRLLEQHFEGIRRWAEFLRSRSQNHIVEFVKFGDWVPIVQTPGNLVSTSYYYWSVDTVAKVAQILGKSSEEQQYRQIAGEIAKAFHEKFYDKQLRRYGNGSQTSNVLPLYLDIAPREARGPVWGNLRHDIVYERDTHLTTGILGTKYLLELASRQQADLAYDLAVQTTYPSWGHMIASGATTLWELWQNKTGPSMNSHNHPMFGSVGAYMFKALAGITTDATETGYRRIRIAPQMVRDLEWCSGSFETVRGPVVSSWSRTPETVKLEATVPFGSKATVQLPKFNLREIVVEEGGRVVWKGGAYQPGGAGITAAKEAGGAIVFEAGGGRYSFVLRGE